MYREQEAERASKPLQLARGGEGGGGAELAGAYEDNGLPRRGDAGAAGAGRLPVAGEMRCGHTSTVADACFDAVNDALCSCENIVLQATVADQVKVNDGFGHRSGGLTPAGK